MRAHYHPILPHLHQAKGIVIQDIRYCKIFTRKALREQGPGFYGPLNALKGVADAAAEGEAADLG